MAFSSPLELAIMLDENSPVVHRSCFLPLCCGCLSKVNVDLVGENFFAPVAVNLTNIHTQAGDFGSSSPGLSPSDESLLLSLLSDPGLMSLDSDPNVLQDSTPPQPNHFEIDGVFSAPVTATFCWECLRPFVVESDDSSPGSVSEGGSYNSGPSSEGVFLSDDENQEDVHALATASGAETGHPATHPDRHRPYFCTKPSKKIPGEMCGATFKHQKDLNRHSCFVHIPPGAPKYWCRCGHLNSRKDNFRRHLNVCSRAAPWYMYGCKCQSLIHVKAVFLEHLEVCKPRSSVGGSD